MGDAFYTGELEAELRLVGQVDYRFKKDSDRELCMDVIEGMGTYLHPAEECTPDCKERVFNTYLTYNNYSFHDNDVICVIYVPGCGNLWVTNGIWKTVFPHCMFRVEVGIHLGVYVLFCPHCPPPPPNLINNQGRI